MVQLSFKNLEISEQSHVKKHVDEVWFNRETRWMVGLDGLRGLFQPSQFHDCVIWRWAVCVHIYLCFQIICLGRY